MDEFITITVKEGCLDQIMQVKQGDWVDLRTAEDVALMPNTYWEISLGVAMKLPKGYEAIVAPRSSTFKKYGVIQVNSIGVIDETYCGEHDIWKMPVYSLRATVIPKGTRIAQFRIIPHQPKIVFAEGELGEHDRGGFGSTGSK